MPVRNAMVTDLTGKIVGKLTVIERRFKIVSERRRSGWDCKCECGRDTWVDTSNLTQKKTISCGVCIKQKPGAAFRAAFRNYKEGARNRGYEFHLTEEQCLDLFGQDCYYCGAKPSNVSTAAWVNEPETFVYQGIDRRVNSEHYTWENCVPCCYVCNKAKGERNEDEFIAHCAMVSQRKS